MFFRQVITKKNGKKYTYLKLIENYRENGKIKQRVVANLGNIENINQDKVNALMSSLDKITDFDTVAKNNKKKSASPSFKTNELDFLWNELKLTEFIQQNQPQKAPPNTALLIKTMVFQKTIFPDEQRPITASYPDLDMPEEMENKIPGIDFHRATESLASIKDELAEHLYKNLIKNKENITPLFCTTITECQYTGNECSINPTGTAYQVMSFQKPLYLAIEYLSPGLPVNCNVIETENVLNTPPQQEQQENKIDTDFKQCLILDENDPNPDYKKLNNSHFYIKSLHPSKFAGIPVSSGDLWSNDDAFTANKSLWVKDISKNKKRYLICHNLSPNTNTDRALEQSISEAENKLAEIQQSIKEKKLRRRNTILNKINDILESHNCKNYIEYRLDINKQQLKFNRKQEVIQKEKNLKRTQVLETNLTTLPSINIIDAFNGRNKLTSQVNEITDLVKLPLIYPYNEIHHCKNYITGQAIMYLLSCLLKDLGISK